MTEYTKGISQEGDIEDYANRIRQNLEKVRSNPELTALRWIWELLQNAKDLPIREDFGRRSIRIEYIENGDNSILTFEHNGDPFTLNDLYGIVKQRSTKSTNSDSTGQFGTGFITSHIIADKIDLKGVVITESEQYEKIYRDFNLHLDRSGKNTEELKPNVRTNIRITDNIDDPTNNNIHNNYQTERKETDYDTKFTFYVSTQTKNKYAQKGFNDLINTMPITLVLQRDKIKKVEVIISGKGCTVYECNPKLVDEFEDTKILLTQVTIDNIPKAFLTYEKANISLTIDINPDLSEGYVLVQRLSTQPVLFCDFPMIGSEKFYFPYMLNCNKFHPNETRNGIDLNGNIDENIIAKENRKLFTEAIKEALSFNQWLIKKDAKNRYLLALSRLPDPLIPFDKDYAKIWIEELQEKWRESLLKQELVETENGAATLDSISIPYYEGKVEDKSQFFDLVHDCNCGQCILPRKEQLLGWYSVLVPTDEYKSWKLNLKYELNDFLRALEAAKSLSSLSALIKKDESKILEWINNFVSFLSLHKQLDKLNDYAVLPNQKGDFCKRDNLCSEQGNIIPLQVKNILDQIPGRMAISESLIHNGIKAELFGSILKVYNYASASMDINSFISDKNQSSDLKNKISALVLSLHMNISDDIIDEHTTELEKNRLKYFDFASQHWEMIYTGIDSMEDNLWNSAEQYWLVVSQTEIESYKCKNENEQETANDQTIECMSKHYFLTPKSNEECLKWLNSYLAFIREKGQGETIKTHKLFPNQNGKLCTLSQLSYDNDISNDIKDLLKTINNGVDKWRECLLDRSILGYDTLNPKKTSDLYNELEKLFKEVPSVQETIAINTIALIPQENPELSVTIVEKESNLASQKESRQTSRPEELYAIVKKIMPNLPAKKYIQEPIGFKYSFAYKFILNQLCQKIAATVNIEGLKKQYADFADLEDDKIIVWIDNVLTHIYSYGKPDYNNIAESNEGKEKNGIWLNQRLEFCLKNQLYPETKIDPIHDSLKDLCRDNPLINKDYRADLYCLKSRHMVKLTNEPIMTKDLLLYIDGIIRQYVEKDKRSMREKNFRQLIYDLRKISTKEKRIDLSIMQYYTDKESTLIVGTLPEGDTMNQISDIIMAGDEQINGFHEVLRAFPKLAITPEKIKEWQMMESVFNGLNRERSQEEIQRDYETGRLGEEYLYQALQKRSDLKQGSVVWYNKDCDAFLQYDFSAETTDGKKVYIEAKSTTTSIVEADSINIPISTREWSFLADKDGSQELYYLARIFNVRSTNPQEYFMRLNKTFL